MRLFRKEFRMWVETAEEADQVAGLARHHFAAIHRDMALGLSACPTIRSTIDGYIQHLRVIRRVSIGRRKYVRTSLGRFADGLSRGAGDISIDQVSREVLMGWMDRRNKKAAATTVNNDLRVLKGYAAWLVNVARKVRRDDLEVFTVEPMRDERYVQGERLEMQTISVAEWGRLKKRIAQVRPDIELVLRFMLLLGARPAALFRMRWRDVEMPAGKANGHVRVPRLKKGSVKVVPLEEKSATAAGLVECMGVCRRVMRLTAGKPVFCCTTGGGELNPGGWTSSTFDNQLRRLCKRLHVRRRFTAYMLRHAAGVWLDERGASSGEMQQYFGHRDSGTQDNYRHATAKIARAAFKFMEEVA